MRKISHIIIHSSNTKPVVDIGVKELDLWDRQRGCFNLASGMAIRYHYVIRRDGTVENGRPVSEPGNHAAGRNANTIGICLVGGKGENDQPENNYTPEQMKALYGLLVKLANAYSVKPWHIVGYSPDSPAFDVTRWLRQENIAEELEETA